ncbi:MAG: hypothetical protein ACXWDL_06020 [Nocardioides sp.]
MKTLQDLRDTLDQHASGVHDDSTTARVAAVAGRARVVRRRRAAGVGAAAVVAVVAAGALAALPGERDIAPAQAPDSFTALGWTYRVADTVDTEGDRVRTDLEVSQLPRLVSWATSGDDQQVEVRSGAEPVSSEVADFGDFVWVPPGFEGEVTVAGGPGLTLATYELDESRAPAGVGEGPLTYREDVAGLELLGAGVGELGQASVEVDLRPEAGMMWLAYHCENLPSGTRVHVNWVGEPGSFSSGGCDSGAAFDPGGSAGIGFPVGRRAGEDAALKIWVTRGGSSVADGAIPDLRLGLGAYTPSEPPAEVAGIDMRQRIEHDGHVWELEDVAVAGAGEVPRIEAPADGIFLVADAVRAGGRIGYSLTVDGIRVGTSTVFVGTGGGGGSRQLVEPGTVTSMRFSTPPERLSAAGLALYRRVD